MEGSLLLTWNCYITNIVIQFLTTIKLNRIGRKPLEIVNWFMSHIKCYLSVNVRCLICCYLAPVNKNLCRVSFLIAHNRTSLSLIYGRLSCHKYLQFLLKLFQANTYCRFKIATPDHASVSKKNKLQITRYSYKLKLYFYWISISSCKYARYFIS